MLLALLASYPLLVHLSILTELPQLQTIAIICFCGGILYRPLSCGKPLAWIVLGLAALAAFGLSRIDATLFALYLPPILLPLMLVIVFGRTLLPGHEPFITAIGEASRGPLDSRMRYYTLWVTRCWCLVFVIMTLWAIVLPSLRQPELWSWFTNVINYVLVGTLFLGEFALRKRLFPEHNHPGFVEYLRIVASARP